MYFKKLELVGFKSFCEKTTLHFEPGITAIVGPNGTGKSNLFDAIRWVLGEQSVKALRGSCMEDVIFNGTDSKEPLGLAEVTLIFDNSKRFFPLEQEEVAITRRIFRSGESEYLLNKTVVRLKDTLDLLAGTGIGAESYSLVEQGKIDLILSIKPEDRRLVFDEASGIIKYKMQKKEALRKLEETEQNLLRVGDIIAEVKRQIGHLERQANKARKYKEVFEELKLKEINLAILQKNKLKKQKNEIINSLSELEVEEAGLLNTIKEQESRINHHQAELKTLQDNISAIKDQILNLDNLVIRDKERIRFNKERIIELDTEKKYLEVQIEQTKNRLMSSDARINNAREEYNSIKKHIEDKSLLLKEKEGELNNISSSIKTSLENIAKAKRDVLEGVCKIANVKNEITDLMAKQQVYLARKKRLEIEKAKVNEEKTVTEDNLSNIIQEVEDLKKISEDLNLKISNLKEGLEQEGLSLSNINSDIENLERQKLSLNSQKEFLEKLKTRYEDIDESMNAIIYLDKLPIKRMTGLVVKIKDYLDLNSQDKIALKYCNLKLAGEAKPIELDTQRISERIVQIQENLDSFKNIKIAKETHMQDLNNAVLELKESLRDHEIALINKKASHKTILEQFNKIKEEQDLIVIELSDVQKELSILEERLNHLRSCLSELDKEQKEVEALISNEQDNIALNSNLKEKVLIIITQTKIELENLTKRISSDEATLKILEDIYGQDKDVLFNLKRQIEETKAKLIFLDLENKDLENKINEAHQNIQSQNSRLKGMEDKYREILTGTGEVDKKIELDRGELDILKNKLYELQMQNKDMDFKISSINDRILQVYKIDLDTLEHTLSELDENPVRNSTQISANPVRDNTDSNNHTMVSNGTNTTVSNEQNLLSQDIQRLKERLDSYGSVNLVAIEEYDELKKRYDFLNQQQNDLISAKESLHGAILKINRIAKKMFLETFEKVRLEFRNYFRLLFNGGDAQIFLIDERDPLESGIEIICRPPGKKLQNVLLLSGGEKALSAIALMFAIFKVKPSPFCVLDEIDASLDEANVDRFGRILQEFTKDSQFIVITHNKRTITNADVMYGITMEESGVSKIVSVKFAQNKAVKDKEMDVVVAEPV